VIPPAPGLPEIADRTESPARDRRGWKASALIGLCCLLVYNANLRPISAGDTYPARYLPFAIVGHQTFFLDPVATVAAQGRPREAYWMPKRADGRLTSFYPVVVPALVSPLYIPAVIYLNATGWGDARLDHLARVMEKLSASLLAALSVSLVYLLLRRRSTPRDALLLTIAYAFGTTTWMISSQALWQHGMAQVLVTGALLLLSAPTTHRGTFAAGALLGLLASNRPPDVILAVAIGFCGILWGGARRIPLLIAGAAVPGLLVMRYNLEMAGSVAGGYGKVALVNFFAHDMTAGVLGLLVSPTRGLLVFSPFLLFLLPTLWTRLRPHGERLALLALGLAVVAQLGLYGRTDWRSGLSWGPRYLTDLLPILMWMLAPPPGTFRGVRKVGFLLATALSIVIEAIGAFAYYASLDNPIYAPDRSAAAAGFDWRNAPFVTSLKAGLAAPEITRPVRGAIDSLTTDGRVTDSIVAGQNLVATGWALVGRATPSHVAVAIDGGEMIPVGKFTDRLDVRAALPGAGPAGWTIPINTTGLAPGEHSVALHVWISERAYAWFLGSRTFTVRPAGEP